MKFKISTLLVIFLFAFYSCDKQPLEQINSTGNAKTTVYQTATKDLSNVYQSIPCEDLEEARYIVIPIYACNNLTLMCVQGPENNDLSTYQPTYEWTVNGTVLSQTGTNVTTTIPTGPMSLNGQLKIYGSDGVTVVETIDFGFTITGTFLQPDVYNTYVGPSTCPDLLNAFLMRSTVSSNQTANKKDFTPAPPIPNPQPEAVALPGGCGGAAAGFYLP